MFEKIERSKQFNASLHVFLVKLEGRLRPFCIFFGAAREVLLEGMLQKFVFYDYVFHVHYYLGFVTCSLVLFMLIGSLACPLVLFVYGKQVW